MKTFFSFLFSLFFSFGTVFANESIDFQVSNQQLHLGDEFEIVVQFENSDINTTELQMEIPGLENFDVFSKGQSFSFKNINGQMQSSLQYKILASPKTLGTFPLGPVKIGNGSGALLDDAVVNIQVGPEKNGQIDVSSSLGESDGEPPKSLEGFQKNNSVYLWIFLCLFAIFCIVGYMMLKKFLSKTQIFEETNEIIPDIPLSKTSHKAFFEELLEQAEYKVHDDFFEELNAELRTIFSEYGVQNAQHKTLAELKTEISSEHHPLFEVFQNTYMTQYQQQESDIGQRKELVRRILSLL